MIGGEWAEVAWTGMCPSLDATNAYPCSATDYLTQELWKDEWLIPGIVLIFVLYELITMPLLVALSVRAQTKFQTRTWLDWAVILSCLSLAGLVVALTISIFLSALSR